MPQIHFFHNNSSSILLHTGPAGLSEPTINLLTNGSLVFQGSCAGFVCVPSQLHFLKIHLPPQSPISLHFPAIPPHVCLVITGHNFPVIKSNCTNMCLCAAHCERTLFRELIIIYTIFVFLLVRLMICVVRETDNIVSHTSKAEMYFNKSQQVTHKPQNTCYRCDLPKPNQAVSVGRNYSSSLQQQSDQHM